MAQELKTGIAAIDLIIDFVGGAITFSTLYYAEHVPIIHMHLPPILMEVTQWAAWAMSISVGLLTLLNLLGFEPKWLQKVKNYFKNKK